MTEHKSHKSLRDRVRILFRFINTMIAPDIKARKSVCLFIYLSLISLSTPLQAKTKLKNVTIKPSSSEFASPPRISVIWNADHTQREVSDENIYIPVELSGRVDNLSKRFEIYKAWIFVNGGTKPITQQIPPYGYSLLRHRKTSRNIGGEQTLVFRKKNLRQLEDQAINICQAKARPDKTSYHRINLPLLLAVTAGKAKLGNHTQVVNQSDDTVIKGDVVCHRKQAGVRSTTSSRGSEAVPRAKEASKLTRSTAPDSVVRSNPRPVRTSPSPVRRNPDPIRTSAPDSQASPQATGQDPDMVIRAVRAENNRSLAVHVFSQGGESGQCVVIARFERRNKPVLTEKRIGPFEHNQTIKSVFRFKPMTSSMPTEINFSLHCPIDRNPDNNDYRYR